MTGKCLVEIQGKAITFLWALDSPDRSPFFLIPSFRYGLQGKEGEAFVNVGIRKTMLPPKERARAV